MRAILIALSALALTACASVKTLGAANDVHALLIAIRDDDQAAFDAHVDRPALKAEIQARLAAEGRRRDPRLAALAQVFGSAVADLVGETLVQPAVFRQVAAHYGYTPQTKIPNALVISQALKPLPDGRICATRSKDGPCLLTFSKGPDGHWRLSGFEGELSELKLKG